MEDKMYAVLFEKGVESENYGLYVFKPITIIEGTYDIDDNLFTDIMGKERRTIEHPAVAFSDDEQFVGFIINEENLKEQYPEAENIQEAKALYFNEIAEDRVEGLLINLDHIKIKREHYNDIVYKFEHDMLKDDDVYDNLNDSHENNNKTFNDYYEELKKGFDGKEITIMLNSYLNDLLNLDSISEIKVRIIKAKENKQDYAKLFANKENELFMMSDDAIEEILKMESLDEIKEELRVLTIKEEDEITPNSFVEDYKMQYGCLMLYSDVNDIRKLIVLQYKYYKQILSDIKTLDHDEEYKYTCEFISDELKILNSICNMKDVNEIKSAYKKVYLNQLKKIDAVAKYLYKNAEFDDMSFNEHENNQMKYEEMYKEKTVEEVINSVSSEMNDLNKLVGLEDVKKEINSFIETLKFQKKTKGFLKPINLNLNMCFTGNAGTGKTTVANIISKMFNKLGYIKSDKIISCTAGDLIAGYVGQTALKTKSLIDEYKNGVIFIDEAYVLASSAQKFGPEAIAEILKELELNRTAFIFAGYTKEMKEFIDSNSGIKSRIGVNIEFKDYSPKELTDILVNLFHEAGYVLDDGVIEEFTKIFEKAKNIPNFGNGRYAKETVFNEIIKQHVLNTKDTYDTDELITITKNDVVIKEIKKEDNHRKIGFMMEQEKPKQKTLGTI